MGRRRTPRDLKVGISDRYVDLDQVMLRKVMTYLLYAVIIGVMGYVALFRILRGCSRFAF